MTTIEITIRFNDRADISAFWEDLVCHFDVAADGDIGASKGKVLALEARVAGCPK